MNVQLNPRFSWLRAPIAAFLLIASFPHAKAASAERLPPAPEGRRTTVTYSWETAPAKVAATGGLEWAPAPFVFTAGPSRRYIDYEGGDDRNDGRSTTSPWKHHPWDSQATAGAAAGRGIHTYVFKRGSAYRGTLLARESGEPGNPIRLTSDPGWGRVMP